MAQRSNFNRGARDPALRLTYRQLGSVWYLEWRAASSAVVTRRKAHDTEATLIQRIRELEAQLAVPSPYRSVADLKLRNISNTLKKVTPNAS